MALPRFRAPDIRAWHLLLALSTLACFASSPARAFTSSRIDLPAAPRSVAGGDLNGDGKPDLVLADNASVSVLLGDGTGLFTAPANYAAGLGPTAVAVADLNGDGRRDVVVTNASSNTVSVLLGNGDGTLATHVDYAVGAQPVSVTIADLDGNGTADLTVANHVDNTVSVLLGS